MTSIKKGLIIFERAAAKSRAGQSSSKKQGRAELLNLTSKIINTFSKRKVIDNITEHPQLIRMQTITAQSYGGFERMV